MTMASREHEEPITSRRVTSVLVALDGSELSWCALDAALALCSEAGAHLTVLALKRRLSPRSDLVLGPERAKHVRDTAAGKTLEEAQVFASYAGVDVRAYGAMPCSWRSVVEYATTRPDLIVLGRKRSFLRGQLLPSSAGRIATRVSCPVQVVRPARATPMVDDPAGSGR